MVNTQNKILKSEPREKDLLITLCSELNWKITFSDTKGISIKINDNYGVGFDSVDSALKWFYRSGKVKKVEKNERRANSTAGV